MDHERLRVLHERIDGELAHSCHDERLVALASLLVRVERRLDERPEAPATLKRRIELAAEAGQPRGCWAPRPGQ